MESVLIYVFLQESDFGAEEENGGDSDYGSVRKSRKSRGSAKHSAPPTPVQETSTSAGGKF